VFRKVLDTGMDIVAQLPSAEVFDFGGVVSQLPLWSPPVSVVYFQLDNCLSIDFARQFLF